MSAQDSQPGGRAGRSGCCPRGSLCRRRLCWAAGRPAWAAMVTRSLSGPQMARSWAGRVCALHSESLGSGPA